MLVESHRGIRCDLIMRCRLLRYAAYLDLDVGIDRLFVLYRHVLAALHMDVDEVVTTRHAADLVGGRGARCTGLTIRILCLFLRLLLLIFRWLFVAATKYVHI